jgi:hypothetical protein
MSSKDELAKMFVNFLVSLITFASVAAAVLTILLIGFIWFLTIGFLGLSIYDCFKFLL